MTCLNSKLSSKDVVRRIFLSVLTLSLFLASNICEGVYGRVEFQASDVGGAKLGPSVLLLKDDKFVTAWGYDSLGYGVSGQIFDEYGNKVGSNIRMIGNRGSVASSPSTATFSSGDFIVVSSGSGDGSDEGIFGQRFDKDGNKIGVEFQVNTVTSYDQTRPDVAVFSDDSFVVVWHSNIDNRMSPKCGIFMQLFDKDANKIGSESQVNTVDVGLGIDPAVVAFGNGNFIVTWDYVGDIKAQLFDRMGEKIDGEFVVNTTTSDNYPIKHSIALLDNGNVVIAWSSHISNYGVFGQIFDEDGNKVGEEFIVNTSASEGHVKIAIAALSNGYFVVVWDYLYGGNLKKIHAQILDASGAKVDSEFQVNTNTELADRKVSPDVAAFGDGGFVVCWQNTNINGDHIACRIVDTFLSASPLFQTLKYIEKAPLRLDPISVDSFNPYVNVTMTFSDPKAGMLNYGSKLGATSVYDFNLGRWKAWGSFAGINSLLSNLVFMPSANYNSDFTIDVLVEDGKESSITQNVNGTITLLGTPAVSKRPSITTSPILLLYNFGDGAKPVDDSISIDYCDWDNLQSATVSMIGNVNLELDSLEFVDQVMIYGYYDKSVGKLFLFGNAPLENYENALRSVSYKHEGKDRSSRFITISFVVNDGLSDSNRAIRGVNVGGAQMPGDTTWNIFASTTVSVVVTGTITISATCLSFIVFEILKQKGLCCYKKSKGESSAELKDALV